MKLEAHQAANLFPMMSGDELAKLAADIKAHGQQHAIVIFNGKILDGRNRYRACEIAGVGPITKTLDACESPTAYVLSANLHRRHLSAAERAAIAVSDEALVSLRAEGRERMDQGRKNGAQRGGRGRPVSSPPDPVEEQSKPFDAVAVAAAAMGVNKNTAYAMQQVKRADPEVYALVRSGEIKSVADARRLAGLEPEKVADQSKNMKRAAPLLALASAKREATDAKILPMLQSGMTQAEVAKELGITSSVVSSVVIRNGLKKSDPLRRLREHIADTTAMFETCLSVFKPEWATADSDQIDDLIKRSEEMFSAVRSFNKRLNKEAKKEAN